MDRTRLQLELNLQTISMVSLATKLWDAPDIKNKIKKFFLEENMSKPRNRDWYKLSRNVLDYVNSLKLPASILIKLQRIVVFIGEKINDWIHHVTKVLELDFIFTEKIYWTSYGMVNVDKIFNVYWKGIMGSPDFTIASNFFHRFPVFSFVCMCADEKFIQDHRCEMINWLAQFYPSIKTSPTENEIYNIMSLSIYLTRNEDVKIFNDNSGRPFNMFERCLDSGFTKAAKFYWNRLDEVEKISNIPDFTEKCLKGQDKCEMFNQEKCCELFIFLINQMQEEEKRTFVTNNVDKIIITLLHVWPYQELIAALFDYDWTDESPKLLNLLDFIIESKGKLNECECPVENELYFQILETTWGKILRDAKRSFVRKNEKKLFINFDIPTLNLILNDPIIKDDYVRKSAARTGVKVLAKNGKFDLIDELMEKVLLSKKPRSWLKEDCSNILRDFIEEGKFDIADQFLDWLSFSIEEKTTLKNQIDVFRICRDLIERLNDFELAENFLKWRFETDEGVKNFKEEVKLLGDFIVTTLGDFVRIKPGDFTGIRPGDILKIKSKSLKGIKSGDLIEMESGGVEESNSNSFTGSKSKIFTGIKSGDLITMTSRSYCSTSQPVDFIGRKSGDYILCSLYKIWNRENERFGKCNNFKSIVNLSTGLVRFYYETDEEVVQFKRNQSNIIDDENFVEFIFKTIFKGYSNYKYDILNEFLKFCLIPIEKIELIKAKFRDEMDKWLDVYVIDHYNLELADFFINWVYETGGREKKRETIKNYLNSSNKGALLCNAYLNEMGEFAGFSGSSVVKIANWLIMIDDIEKLKNDLRVLNENVPDWFISLLDKLTDKDVLSAVNAVRIEFFGVGVGLGFIF